MEAHASAKRERERETDNGNENMKGNYLLSFSQAITGSCTRSGANRSQTGQDAGTKGEGVTHYNTVLPNLSLLE